MLKRKIDLFLNKWFNNSKKHPLIIRGPKLIGKTTSIMNFAKTHYENIIYINLIDDKKYKKAFEYNNQSQVLSCLLKINPTLKFIPNKTIIIIDEIQECPNVCTSLKSFSLEKQYDIICIGVILDIHLEKIQSIPVGYKHEYIMRSLDFEEFLWANGYDEFQIDNVYSYLKQLKPLPIELYNNLLKLFKDYITIGGMPEIVDEYIKGKAINELLSMQYSIYQTYKNEIKNYVEKKNVKKIELIFDNITKELISNDDKFEIYDSSIRYKTYNYYECINSLIDAGVINIAYNLQSFDLPLKGNEIDNYFRIYYSDTSLLLSSIDEESKKDFIINGNYQIYNGALFENIVAEALTKQGYEDIFFYKNDSATIELDFVIRVKNEIIPIEVKAKKGRAKSLRTLLDENIVNYGIKLSNNNIGFDGKIFTIPSFLTFLLKRFFNETDYIKW